jgi:hypothetical protein
LEKKLPTGAHKKRSKCGINEKGHQVMLSFLKKNWLSQNKGSESKISTKLKKHKSIPQNF